MASLPIGKLGKYAKAYDFLMFIRRSPAGDGRALLFNSENHYPKFGKHLPKDTYNNKCVKNKAATAGLFSIYHKIGSERDLRATLTAILDDLEARLNNA